MLVRLLMGKWKPLMEKILGFHLHSTSLHKFLPTQRLTSVFCNFRRTLRGECCQMRALHLRHGERCVWEQTPWRSEQNEGLIARRSQRRWHLQADARWWKKTSSCLGVQSFWAGLPVAMSTVLSLASRVGCVGISRLGHRVLEIRCIHRRLARDWSVVF